MSQANPPASGDRSQAVPLLTCPYRSCNQQMRYPANPRKSNHILCDVCQGPIFLDYCPLCKTWNVIPVRVAETHSCKTPACKNRLSVTKQQCPLCKKGASLLTSAATPNDFFCSECKQTGKIGSTSSHLDLDEASLLDSVGQEKDKRLSGATSSSAAPSKAAGTPQRTAAPATGAATFVGNKPAAGGAVEAKLDLLLKSIQELKDALDFYPNENLPENLSDSKLAALFHKIEFALLGPKDTEGKTKSGKTVKTRKWTHVPSAIRKLLEESAKNQSAEEDEESPNKEGRGRLWGLGGSRQARSDNGNAPRDPSSDMTAAFDLVQQIQKLNLSLLKRIPDLMDAIEGSLEDEVQRHQSDGTLGGVGTVVESVKQRVDGQLANWLGVNGLIKEVPETSEKYDPQRHDRDDDRPTKNSELDGLIHSVLQPGYRYDDGQTQMVLRRPRVLVWYLE